MSKLTSLAGGEDGAGSAGIGVGGVGESDVWTVLVGVGVVPAVGPTTLKYRKLSISFMINLIRNLISH